MKGVGRPVLSVQGTAVLYPMAETLYNKSESFQSLLGVLLGMKKEREDLASEKKINCCGLNACVLLKCQLLIHLSRQLF